MRQILSLLTSFNKASWTRQKDRLGIVHMKFSCWMKMLCSLCLLWIFDHRIQLTVGVALDFLVVLGAGSLLATVSGASTFVWSSKKKEGTQLLLSFFFSYYILLSFFHPYTTFYSTVSAVFEQNLTIQILTWFSHDTLAGRALRFLLLFAISGRFGRADLLVAL